MIKLNTLKLLILCAALAMLLPLPVMQYVGEESYYTLGAYEMFINKNWWHQTLFGLFLPKTPLYNWLIIIVAQIIGWEHLEIAPRIVSVFSSWASAFVAYKMTRHFFPQHAYAGWLAVLIYLTMGEVSFWYGWLGYADATFGFFIFSAISCLWLAIEKKKSSYFLASLLLISLAFMTKNISCYAIFGLAAIVLLQRFHHWHLLLKPFFIVPGLLTLTVPWIYQTLFIQTGSNADFSIHHAIFNFIGYGLFDYIYHWVSYPILFLARAFPVTLLLAWFFWRGKQRFSMDSNMLTLAWMLLICMAPFWLSAGASPRYLVPFYGLFSLLLTAFALQLDTDKIKLMLKVMLLIIVVKIPYSFAILPYIKDWRPERGINIVAEEIFQIADHKMIRTRGFASTGLSIVAYLNVKQLPPVQYIHWYDGEEKQVYILSDTKIPELGEIVKSYRLQGNDVFLYWQP